jgi:hypothetical protein
MQGNVLYNYYVLGHYSSSRLCLKCRPAYISKHSVSATGFYPRHQAKPTQLYPIDRASPYLLTADNNERTYRESEREMDIFRQPVFT